MRVVLVGGGGREHALALRIAASPSLSALAVTHDNPGWPKGVVRVDGADVVATARAFKADLVVVGPEAPLEQGLADALADAGIPCFGPQKGAALMESSKSFAKDIMAAAGVPTAAHLTIDRSNPADVAAAKARCALGRVVVKADGLAAGKGVIVCPTADEAMVALDAMWSGRFGAAADRLVLEDLMEGPEISIFALCDGERVVALPASQDHKTLLDGNLGPNTGGMGAYAPCPLVSPEETERIVQEVHLPVIQELARRGTPYRGVLYGGLMLTAEGPKVIEFNVRFGDPECQSIMSLWADDILPWLAGAASGRLPQGQPAFSSDFACCVVLASAGYPLTSTKGVHIPEPTPSQHVTAFFAGAKRDDEGVLRTNGGRVLGITGIGPDAQTARDRAYAAVEGWRFDGAQTRSDIAAQACP